MSKELIILDDIDISRLAENKHVPLYMRHVETGEKRMIIIMSDKCYDAYMRDEYDLEQEELSRQSFLNPNLLS